MNISKELADQIIYSLKDALNLELNLIDTDGMIISSTNKYRENTFHEAAKICFETKNMVVIEKDDEYKGVKKGINLPVEFQHNVVAIVGITGEPKEVSNYATIIRKMTEILLREEWVKENRFQRKSNMRNIIEGVIVNEYENVNFYTGHIENTSKHFLVTKPVDGTKGVDYIYDALDMEFINNLDIIYTYLFNELILLVNNKSKGQIEKAVDNFIEKNNLDVKFGISQEFTDLSKANFYLKQAQDAYYWTNKMSYDKNVLFYENMSLGVLLSNIDEDKKNSYVTKVLGNIKDDEIELYSTLINLYGTENGSITKISDALFMHKNTIQYRLNRLHELTGYNPRNHNDYVVLRIAFLLRD